MPLTIRLTVNPAVGPRVEPVAEVRKMAQQVGNPNHQRAIAVTVPVVRSNTSAVEWRPTANPGFGVTVQFDRGTLALTLTQVIYLADAPELPACAHPAWRQHEQGHVTDNEQLFRTRLEPALRADPEFQEIFSLNPFPRPGHGIYPHRELQAVLNRINPIIARVWRTLTATAVRHRDTPAEYAHAAGQARQACRPGR